MKIPRQFTEDISNDAVSRIVDKVNTFMSQKEGTIELDIIDDYDNVVTTTYDREKIVSKARCYPKLNYFDFSHPVASHMKFSRSLTGKLTMGRGIGAECSKLLDFNINDVVNTCLMNFSRGREKVFYISALTFVEEIVYDGKEIDITIVTDVRVDVKMI